MTAQWLLLPSAAVAIAAWVLVALRALELLLRAPVHAPPFAKALRARLESGDVSEAQRLCEPLRSGWAAQVALRVLAAPPHSLQLAFVLDDLRAEFRMAAQTHLLAISTLGRIAVPLALGAAIVQLGLGFQLDQPGLSASHTQHVLDSALRLGVIGLTTSVFCQLSAANLQRQALARLDEVRVVSETLLATLSRPS
jgi:hypothetical protein